MSSETFAVRARNVGKVYTIRHDTGKETSLFATVGRRIRHPFRRSDKEQFWALRDVSFDIREGEVVGFIGKNGAGKSTLLKVLSRITAPTTGAIDLYGRVGSLLEVGTGFHPELTGRENVYLNGGILGMKRYEIDEKFDEIIDFAGTERFLDTPVKRYSSGMYVRLAFAVAAHLNPEILIVDEVLSVGDAEFQAKCLGKMQNFARGGRTVLFVSHNMAAVQKLCERAVLLRAGQITADGKPQAVIQDYLQALQETGSLSTPPEQRTGTGSVQVSGVRLVDGSGTPTGTVVAGADLTLQIDYKNHRSLRTPRLLVNIYTGDGGPVTSISTELTNPALAPLHESGRFVCRIPRVPLLPGRYRLAIGFRADGERTDYLPAALMFDVGTSLFFPTGRVPAPGYASFMMDHAWEHQPLDHQSPDLSSLAEAYGS